MTDFPVGSKVQFVTSTISFDVSRRTARNLRSRDTDCTMIVETPRDSSGMFGLRDPREKGTIKLFARADEMRSMR